MDYENLSNDELARTRAGLQVATMKAAAYLSLQVGDADKARRHIRLALDLPPRVLQRRYNKAHAAIEANKQLSVDEAAAWVACGYNTVRVLTGLLERKSATLQ